MTINLLANTGFPLPRKSQDVLFGEMLEHKSPNETRFGCPAAGV